MRRGQPQPEPRRARVVTTVRRVWPVALEAWRRWERLPDHQKERYRQMASDYTRRGRDAWARSQKQRRR